MAKELPQKRSTFLKVGLTLVVGLCLFQFRGLLMKYYQNDGERPFANLVHELRLLVDANGRCLLHFESTDRKLASFNPDGRDLFQVSQVNIRTDARSIASVGKEYKGFTLEQLEIVELDKNKRKVVRDNITYYAELKLVAQDHADPNAPKRIEHIPLLINSKRNGRVLSCAPVPN